MNRRGLEPFALNLELVGGSAAKVAARKSNSAAFFILFFSGEAAVGILKTLYKNRAIASAVGSFLGKELPTGLRLANGKGPQDLTGALSRLKVRSSARYYCAQTRWDILSCRWTIQLRGGKAGCNFFPAGGAQPMGPGKGERTSSYDSAPPAR